MDMIGQEEQQLLRVLEGRGELVQQLEEGLQELQEHRRALLREHCAVHAVSAAVLELVSEGAPVLLHQRRQPLHGAVVRVQHHLHQTADLRRAVPAVRAVHQHARRLEVQLLRRERAGQQQQLGVSEPGGLLQALEEPRPLQLLPVLRLLLRGQGLCERDGGGPHDVDVVDVAEDQLRVGVRRHVFCALAHGHVQGGRHLAAGVQDVQLAVCVGLRVEVCGAAPGANVAQQQLVLHALAVRQARERLRGPGQHGPVGVAVGQRGQAVPAAELRRREQLRAAHVGGQGQVARVGVAEGLWRRGVVQHPPVRAVEEALPHELLADVAQVPAQVRRRQGRAVPEREQQLPLLAVQALRAGGSRGGGGQVAQGLEKSEQGVALVPQVLDAGERDPQGAVVLGGQEERAAGRALPQSEQAAQRQRQPIEERGHLEAGVLRRGGVGPAQGQQQQAEVGDQQLARHLQAASPGPRAQEEAPVHPFLLPQGHHLAGQQPQLQRGVSRGHRRGAGQGEPLQQAVPEAGHEGVPQHVEQVAEVEARRRAAQTQHLVQVLVRHRQVHPHQGPPEVLRADAARAAEVNLHEGRPDHLAGLTQQLYIVVEATCNGVICKDEPLAMCVHVRYFAYLQINFIAAVARYVLYIMT
mmetsp:Transcript_9465/g.14151  ORF Transcript_9465/g.14151 Transcript_9465/m.14151 type:complete len:639 (+) Transcript_9465:434-2350(+)